MDDLLKEAIADAKAVRETAIENAKLALEEAFTPTIQSMLSKKLQSEIDGEEEVTEDEDEEMKKDDEDEDMDEMRMKDADEDPSDEDSKEDDDMEEMRMKDEDEEEEVDESEIIEIDGVKYAPVVDEVEVDEMKDEEEMEDEKDDEDEMDEELDLEAVIKELESELEEDDEPADEEPVAEGDEEEETVDENDVSSGIGKGDNAHDKKSGSSTDIGKAGKGKMTEGEEEEEEVDEEVDLEEILKSLEEENEVEEEGNKVETLEAELKEYRDTVEVLRGELSEVNMLNAKLLFTNKLFRAYGLSEAQKVKVIETFDRAKNIREVKLVYSTLAESFGSKNEVVNESVKVKGSASKATASTKSEATEEVITEGNVMRNRFKKLANIL